MNLCPLPADANAIECQAAILWIPENVKAGAMRAAASIGMSGLMWPIHFMWCHGAFPANPSGRRRPAAVAARPMLRCSVNGLCMVLVRAGRKAGKIQIAAFAVDIHRGVVHLRAARA